MRSEKKPVNSSFAEFLSRALFLLGTMIFPLWLMAANLTIEPHVTDINGHGNANAVGPGDTIFLKPGLKQFLWIAWLHGTKDDPVVIMNLGGLVEISGFKYGLKFDSCSNVRFTGRGDAWFRYGVLIRDISGAGVTVEGRSTGIEIEGVEVRNVTLVGIFAKSDPTCTNFSSTREKYMLRDLSIHDNYIHHTGMEGMYIGNVFYLGYTLSCNGKDTTVYPHLLRNVEIYNNIVEYTAWDGIQVSSTDSACRIRNNIVRFDSQSEKTSQMSGILLGGGSRCDCYNNRIDSGKGDGIEVFSLGDHAIYNNSIFLAGKSYKPGWNFSPYMKYGIFCGQYLSIPASRIAIYHNTICSPKSYGIMINNYVSGYDLCNNIIVDPGSFSQVGNLSYVNQANPTMDVNMCSANFFQRYYGDVNFVDAAHGNFDLTRFSGAVNAAINIPGFDLFFDALYRIRPFAIKNDIGAFECQDPALLTIPESSASGSFSANAVMHPAMESIVLHLEVFRPVTLQIILCDLSGRTLLNRPPEFFPPGKHTRNLSVRPGRDAIYILSISSPDGIVTRKITILNQ